MRKYALFIAALLFIAFAVNMSAQPRYDMEKLFREKLNRGVVAIRSNGKVVVSWRQLTSDAANQAFDVYRNGKKLNTEPLTSGGTFFVDEHPLVSGATYEVRGGGKNGSFALKANAPEGYLPVKLQRPDGGVTPDGEQFTYSANDASVADVDGDGQYEILLKWDPSNAHDNAHDGYTCPTIFDCYRLDGKLLWRIDMGINIRSGAHYVPFIFYDLDGDGRAEFIVRTSDGTRDGQGRVIGDTKADYRHHPTSGTQEPTPQKEWDKYNKPGRPMTGRILTGNEYITVFNGLTGKAMDTKPYIPERGKLSDWGDNYANRSDRMLAGVGYLDGKHASAIFCRGYYTRTVIAAWDWDGRKLRQHWVFDTNTPQWASYAGQGNHNLRVADVDGDGCDEITYGSMAVDHDGRGLYNTGMGHGDAIHLMAFDPSTPELQVWDCHENRRDGSDFRNARTGKVLFQVPSKSDVGRCMAADIDPTNPGVEMWSSDSHGIRNIRGEVIYSAQDPDDPQHQQHLKLNGRHLSVNFGIWWDGDLLRELLDRATVSKYDWKNHTIVDVMKFPGVVFNNGTKSTPCLSADILGDWREEVIARTPESDELRIFVSPIPTDYRITCLMEDIPYRLSTAAQNVGYNQPSEPGFYLGADMSLAKHNFFYAGQSKRMRMFILKNGQLDWTFEDTQRRGEISDAILMTDGHIMIAHQYGIAEITKDNQTVWQYDAPAGTEIHTIQPIGKTHVVFVQNGKPAKAVVMEIPSKKIVREFVLPTSEKGSVHGQFRNARLTSRGTLLVANMALGCIHEYNSDGKEIDRWDGFLPWSVQELPKGNLLITGRKGRIQEITRMGETVWELNTTDYGITQPQKTVRLKNGNHIVNNWYNEWNKTPMDSANAPVQAVEIDKTGKIVWQLRAWEKPDLGPSTTIQLLDDAVNRDRLFFGEFNPQFPKLFVGPNEPIGVGRGIHPGRVAWIHCPGVANWDGRTGLWVEDRWNNQQKADAMMTEAILQLTGEPTAQKAWTALFKNFNKTHGRGNRSYKQGEKIAIKLNINNAITHHDTIELNSSPFVTLALVRSLVRDGGVREQDITLCEPSRAITDSIYNKIHREFPHVVFIDNLGGDGRQKCEYYPEQIVYSVDNGKIARGLAKCIVDADYLINSALLKTHSGPGVTLTTKNWYGATDINLLWRQNSHSNISQDKRHGKPGYKTFVDWMSHKHMGGKALLLLIDGTYGSRDVNGAPAPKWQKAPFNGDWACSLIVSQDEVACDAVGMDILINEWPEFGSLNYCDEYLREAASIPNAPSGTVYKQDGKPLTSSLGLFEHWNKDHKYSKIDLRYKKLEVVPDAFQGILPVTDAKMQKSLNGQWNLKVVEGITADATVPAADDSWGKIPVPGCWENYGFCKAKYDSPNALTGYYRTKFSVPEEWRGQRIVLRFDGVLYGYDLWINGHQAGSWRSGYNTALFDITDYLVQGEQELAMRVISQFPGSDFDYNDDWAPNGIFRDVTLMAVPCIHLSDLTIHTQNDGTVDVKTVIANGDKHTNVSHEILDAQGKVVGSNKVNHPNLWTAETPYLYTLRTTLKQKGKKLQTFHHKFGFRELTIDGKVIKLNGQPIKFRGVTCHATDPNTGKVISDSLTLKDMKLMKEASINYIRTSHYPREPRFYELADSLGFYIIDEVPFGYGDKNLYKKEFYPVLQQRAQATIRRDKNHASVLIWSLGNENPLTDICVQLGEYVKSQLDTVRPICYPQIGSYFRSFNYKLPKVIDIYAPHYPTTEQLKDFYQRADRPVIFTEYLHTLGVSFEDHDRQWEIIERTPCLAGGSVWEWVDQGMKFGARNVNRYGYEEKVYTSATEGFEMCGNKGTDGLLYADRTPLPNYYELQHNYARTFVSEVNGSELKIVNRYDFLNLKNNVTFHWALTNNRDTVQRGSFSVDCQPHAETTYQLSLPRKDGLSLLQLAIEDAQGNTFLRQNFVLNKPERLIDTSILTPHSTLPIQEGPLVRVGRKPTLAETMRVKSESIARYLQPLDNPYVKAEVKSDGNSYSYTLTPVDTVHHFLGELGIAWLLDSKIDRVQWIGHGPFASYPGRQQANRYGIWSMQKDDLYFEGNRMGIDAAWFSDKDGNGILIAGNQLNINFEQTDRGLLVTVNAAVCGQGPKFSKTAFGVWSNEVGTKNGAFQLYRTEAGSLISPFAPPAKIQSLFRPFFKQYDTYLMKYNDIKQ